MATKILPKEYALVKTITMKTNKKLMVGLNVAVLVLLVPFVVGLYKMMQPWLQEGMELREAFFFLLFTGVGTILILVMHELVHGIFIKNYSRDKVTYGFNGLFASAGSPDYYFTKKEYIVIALAPFVLIDLVLMGLLLLAGGWVFYGIYMVLALHATGCIGDLYVFIQIIRYPRSTYMRDTGLEMFFYTT